MFPLAFQIDVISIWISPQRLFPIVKDFVVAYNAAATREMERSWEIWISFAALCFPLYVNKENRGTIISSVFSYNFFNENSPKIFLMKYLKQENNQNI